GLCPPVFPGRTLRLTSPAWLERYSRRVIHAIWSYLRRDSVSQPLVSFFYQKLAPGFRRYISRGFSLRRLFSASGSPRFPPGPPVPRRKDSFPGCSSCRDIPCGSPVPPPLLPPAVPPRTAAQLPPPG